MSDMFLVGSKRRMFIQKLENSNLGSILFGLRTRDRDNIVIIMRDILRDPEWKKIGTKGNLRP